MTARAIAASRSQLLSLLSQACELEHGLACCYLYAGLSLKQDLGEGGLTWQQLQPVRLWASEILQVAAEEMLHLAQAWNLLTAVGGTPWYQRPNFPQPSTAYPLHLPLETKPFSLETIERFIAFEHPHDPTAAPLPPDAGESTAAYRSVGELYARIADHITSLDQDELFIADPDRQVGSDLVDFPNLTPVVGQQTALQAIEVITEQGEGTPGDRDDSHYDIFKRVRQSYLHELAAAAQTNACYDPVRPCIENPTTRPASAPSANTITNPKTVNVAELFDDLYMLMLRLLQYVFDSATRNHDKQLEPYAEAALRLMTTVLKPLGEALTLMPAGSAFDNATAGPTFNTGRAVPLPLTPSLALTVASERLTELQERLQLAAAIEDTPPHLQHAAASLARIRINAAAAV